MILGMTTATYTFVHVLISLIGIGSGFIVLYGLLSRKQLDGWTALFLATTVATSVTGFGFPAHKLLPSHVIGILSLVVLTLAIFARYIFHLAGAWRRVYIVGAIVALYFNVFVAIVQAFEKNPMLKALAPTQKEAPFVATQLLVMASFIVLGIVAVKKSRIESVRITARAA